MSAAAVAVASSGCAIPSFVGRNQNTTTSSLHRSPSLAFSVRRSNTCLPPPPLLGFNATAAAAAAPSSLFLGAPFPSGPRPPVNSRSSSSFRCSSALSPQLKTTIHKVITSNKVVLFMKGNKDFPQCGFSNTVVQILKSFNLPFETLDILENELLRQGLKEYSNWPTFPQLYIDGEFFGGCDITVEAYKSGELQEVLERAICS